MLLLDGSSIRLVLLLEIQIRATYLPMIYIYIYIFFFCNIFQGKHKDSGTDHILLLHLLGGSWQALISAFMCSSK
jgi:hypothetical protein